MAKDGREEVGADRCIPRAPWFGTCFVPPGQTFAGVARMTVPPTSFCNYRIHPHLFLLPGTSSKPQGLCNNSVMLVAKDKFLLVWCVLCWSLLQRAGWGRGWGYPPLWSQVPALWGGLCFQKGPRAGQTHLDCSSPRS